MKKGLLYKVVTYPGLIALKEGFGVLLNFEGYNFSVRVQQHATVLEILDYNNDIITNKISGNQTESNLKKNRIEVSDKKFFVQIENSKLIVENIGKNCNSYRTRDMTNLLFEIEVDDIEKTNNLEEKFAEILKYFLKIYRVKSGDIYSKFPDDLNHELIVTREGKILYSKEELGMAINKRLNAERSVSLGIKSLKMPNSFTIGSKRNMDFDKNGEVIKKFIDSKNKISQIDEFYLKAKEEFYVNNNYKYGILELFTMIEVLIVDKLTKYKLANGVSKKRLKDFKKDIPISYLINVELPLILNNITDYDRGVLGKIDSIRKIRNDIVHENKKPTKEECEFAFKAVNDFLGILNKNRL
ncbi:hypothetical protein [Tamlana crocina]|uniref:Apea-like HEPN domain-containing protein n=1 Tax=Tamlana crocina TaxID=393006 RepID=A0ABX1DGY2_9FLAO|nr:hypothetical protein [Tamlana crocina]NJX16263.1 hypothetical protein [Tamlana crocina]